MRILSALFQFFFGRCAGGHHWNDSGVCVRCGNRCPHAAYVGKSVGEQSDVTKRVFTCMDCGAVADGPHKNRVGYAAGRMLVDGRHNT
jgi:hypothetical protein